MIHADLQKLVDKAGEMARHNIWGEKAYKINRVILKMDRENTAACTRLAKYFRLLGDMTEAKNMYLKALEIDPGNLGAINNLEDLERDQKECDAVEKINSIGELFKEGQKSVSKGKYNLAVKLFSKAYGMEPLLMYAVGLAGAYKKLGEYDRIEKLYCQLIDSHPEETDVSAINKEFKGLRLHNIVS